MHAVARGELVAQRTEAPRARATARARAPAVRARLRRRRGAAERSCRCARAAACPHPLSRTLCFSNNSFDKCAAINRRIDDESADNIVLRCFLRDIVTVDLNFISEVQRKEEGGERRERENLREGSE